MKRKNISSLVFGLALLALAILFLGRAAGWWDLSVLFPGWWTLFLIVPGVVSVINDGFNAGNGILTGIGVLLLLNAQGITKLSGLWIAALVLGIAGGGLAFLAQWGLYKALETKVAQSLAISFVQIGPFSQVWVIVLVAFLAVGVLVGAVGGVIAIRNYLKV